MTDTSGKPGEIMTFEEAWAEFREEALFAAPPDLIPAFRRVYAQGVMDAMARVLNHSVKGVPSDFYLTAFHKFWDEAEQMGARRREVHKADGWR